MRTVLASLVALLVAFGSSCSGPCTLIGCTNTLTVRVTDAQGGAVSAFKGSVTIGDQKTAVECGAGPGSTTGEFECLPGAVAVRAMVSHLPPTVDISLTTGDGAAGFTGTVSPVERVVTYPNGRECDSGCESASADVVLR